MLKALVFQLLESTSLSSHRFENSNSPPPYTLEGAGHVLKRKNAKPGKRATRGALQSKKVAKTFTALLEDAALDRVPPEIPTYITAAAAPSKVRRLQTVAHRRNNAIARSLFTSSLLKLQP